MSRESGDACRPMTRSEGRGNTVARQEKEKPAVRAAETGWLRAGRRRDGNPRTCVAAVLDENTPPAARGGADGTIVRGED